MDLVSGYLVFEEVAPDRSSETWNTRVVARLEALGTEVRYLVSDRAKALVKLAETGLGCLSIPDFLHLIHELVRSYTLAMARRLRQARQALPHAQARLAKCEASDPRSVDTQQAQAVVAARRAEVIHWEMVRCTSQRHLETVSLIVHPWRLGNSTRQTSADVERRLRDELNAIEAFIETTGLPVKKKALSKVRKQLAGLSALIDVWWQGGRARFTASHPDTEVEALGYRGVVTTAVLAGATGAHALPTTKNQNVADVRGRPSGL